MDKEIKIIDDLFNIVLQLGKAQAKTVWNKTCRPQYYDPYSW